jgi:hypothetical protein
MIRLHIGTFCPDRNVNSQKGKHGHRDSKTNTRYPVTSLVHQIGGTLFVPEGFFSERRAFLRLSMILLGRC